MSAAKNRGCQSRPPLLDTRQAPPPLPRQQSIVAAPVIASGGCDGYCTGEKTAAAARAALAPVRQRRGGGSSRNGGSGEASSTGGEHKRPTAGPRYSIAKYSLRPRLVRPLLPGRIRVRQQRRCADCANGRHQCGWKVGARPGDTRWGRQRERQNQARIRGVSRVAREE